METAPGVREEAQRCVTQHQEETMKTRLVIIVLTLAACIAEGGPSLINAKAPEFSLRDQYDQSFSLQSFAGHPVVLLASDKGGHDQNHQWLALLKEKYGRKIRIVGVADVRTVPFFLKGVVRSDFKKEEGSVLMDWDGVVFTSYGLAPGVANVVLIDGSGIVRDLRSGKPSQEEAARMFNEIDGVMKTRP
jgi:hypothetical protein